MSSLESHVVKSRLQPKRLGVSFHRTFALSRSAVSQVLALSLGAGAASNEQEGGLSRDDIREGTSLGTVYVESMPRYARGCGLIDAHNRPTCFGRIANVHDGTLGGINTQWLMHYHLSSPHGAGPRYWGHVVSNCFRLGDYLDRQCLSTELEVFLAASERKPPGKNTVDAAATTFLGTYSKDDALGPLGILVAQGNRYLVSESEEPSLAVFAYVLADYWDGMWPGRKTVNLEAITSEPEGPASLLLLGTGQANRLLRAMQDEGWVQVQRRAAPYTVVRSWEDSAPFLERVYA